MFSPHASQATRFIHEAVRENDTRRSRDLEVAWTRKPIGLNYAK